MKTIQVEIEGMTPLLMNNPKAMLEPKEAVRKTTKKYDVESEAEKSAYKNDKGQLYVPATAIKGSMINASSWKKAGKNSLKPLIACGVKIAEHELILNKQKYEIDVRTVVIQRARVAKARAMVKDWKLVFNLQYNDSLIGDADIIKQVLSEAGERVGLLDFRPQKLGDFGTFKVTKFKVM